MARNYKLDSHKHFPYGNDAWVWITRFSCFAFINGATLYRPMQVPYFFVFFLCSKLHVWLMAFIGVRPCTAKQEELIISTKAHSSVTLNLLDFRCRLECSHWSDIRCVKLAEGESFFQYFLRGSGATHSSISLRWVAQAPTIWFASRTK